ncbi:Starch binding domain-containing protein [Burkholderia cepacia]|nr:Starch binding domain-containing protein [Burkholderia cepacia]
MERVHVVCARYSNCVIPPPAGQVAVAVNITASTQPGQYMYVTGSADALGNWNTNLGVPVDPSRYRVWSNIVNLRGNTPILYKYYLKNGDGSVTWENLPGSRNRVLTTPKAGAVTLNDKVNW